MHIRLTMPLDEKLVYYNSLPLTRYPHLAELTIQQVNRDEGGYQLNITLALRGADNLGLLKIQFSDVRSLKLETPGTLELLLFKIYDIRDEQWEGLAYRVREDEHDHISFYCRDFTVRLERTNGSSVVN